MHGDIVTFKYWNTNGVSVAIVAVEGAVHDVGAYIGGDSNSKANQEDTFLRVIKFGAKLTKQEAFSMLPQLKDIMRVNSLRYRD